MPTKVIFKTDSQRQPGQQELRTLVKGRPALRGSEVGSKCRYVLCVPAFKSHATAFALGFGCQRFSPG